jgi:ubiquinone/menaquinone biosynthesis C-methylase UbiE
MEKQRDVFMDSEGDAWYQRNQRALAARRLPDDDPVLMELIPLIEADPETRRVLEIGCGDGTRLGWLQDNLGVRCHGIDPSADAVEAARNRGIEATQGTAESLPFESDRFNVLIFGFCLYLCDREDLFRVAAEADRVLAAPGWLLILDFYSPAPVSRPYHHREGLFTYKMDYRSLFTWHPAYECYIHKVRAQIAGNDYVDDPGEWVATSVLRKRPVSPR